MRKRFPRPKPGHAGQRIRIPRCPVYGARLLLHDPPTAPTHGAVKIMVKGLKIGIALPHKTAFVLGRSRQPIRQKAQRIGIPRRDIQIGPGGEMIKIGDLAHVIMRNRIGAVFADDVGLQAVEADHFIGCKAAVRHHMGGIGFGYRQVGQVYSVKTVIIHRPEHIAPSPVQRIRRLIALRQPIAESLRCGGGIRQGCVVTGIFIVGLPSGHMGIAAIAYGHRRCDLDTFGAVGAVAETIVPPRAKAAWFAVTVNRQHVGMFGQHPARWRSRRGAKHNFQPRLAQSVNGPVKPIPIICAGNRFHPAPGELADPHPCQTQRGHAGGIADPLGFGPMFGIITDAKGAFHNVT